MQLQPLTSLQNGKYRIIRILGQGGFGITYLAEHTMLDKKVAIKEFFPKEYCDRDENSHSISAGTKNSVEIIEILKSKFIKEAKNISKLNHPNIITIHDIFRENETAYYVMEYIEGDSMSEMIKRDGPIPELQALVYIAKVGDAVEYMHSMSMNHLDIKPANIMVRAEDNSPVLIDFGLSKQYDSSGDQTSTTPIGISHGYAPIEQYRPGGVSIFSPQTDVYALGATLYALLTGQTPPHYSDILEDGLPELPISVSLRTAQAIEKAMEIKKTKRPASIKEFLSLLSIGSNTKSTPFGTSTNETLYSQNKASETAAENKRFKNDSEEKHQKNYKQNTSDPFEQTMFMGDNHIRNNISAKDNTVIIDNIKFVDLGLSVRWADINLGASRIEEAGKFYYRGIDGNLNDLYEWNAKGAIVPSIAHYHELITHCKWQWSEINNTMGYTVQGPNGNTIFLPVTGDGLTYPGKDIVTFGLLWTNEALLNQWRDESKLLYFNSSLYKLTNYSTNKICPLRLITPL